MSRSGAAYDLLIAGGGPAGTSAAITAARLGARVLLLERGRFPRHKVCGEFVSPESLELLESLLGSEPEAAVMLRSAPRISQARAFIADECVEFPLATPAASISRLDLDAALWKSAAAAGAQARQGITVEGIEREELFKATTSGGAFAAKSAINASGRWSNLNPAAPPRSSRGAAWLGVKAHFLEDSPPASVDLYFFEGGYCGVQPLGGGRVNACAMVRSDRARSLDEVFALQPRLAERSRRWQPVTDAVVTSPFVFRAPRPLRFGLLQAGDAAGFLDPFVGDGISAALHSGALAAQALSDCWQGRATLKQAALQYQREYERTLQPAFRTAGRIRWLLHLPAALRAPALQMLRVRPVARYLVRKTRAAVS